MPTLRSRSEPQKHLQQIQDRLTRCVLEQAEQKLSIQELREAVVELKSALYNSPCETACQGPKQPTTQEFEQAGTLSRVRPRWTKVGRAASRSRSLAAMGTFGEMGAWRFRNSCWDAASFICDSDLMMSMESFAVACLLLVNIIMQLSFVVIVSLSLAESSWNDDRILGYRLWRTNTAHSVQFMDRTE